MVNMENKDYKECDRHGFITKLSKMFKSEYNAFVDILVLWKPYDVIMI